MKLHVVKLLTKWRLSILQQDSFAIKLLFIIIIFVFIMFLLFVLFRLLCLLSLVICVCFFAVCLIGNLAVDTAW
jgi:hypothetical protein